MWFKNWVFWLNSTLLHGIVIVLLWFPQPLHFPTREDLAYTWGNISSYIKRTTHPEEFARAEQQKQEAARQRIAQLPPPLIERAKQINKANPIICPQEARTAMLFGKVPLTADINTQGKVVKVLLLEPTENTQINQQSIQNFSKVHFSPAIDAQNKPAPDQIQLFWPYDCRR